MRIVQSQCFIDGVIFYSLIVVSTFLLPSTLSSQSDKDYHWRLSPGYAFCRITDVNGVGRGPVLTVDRDFSKHIGIEFTPHIIFDSDGFYDFRGIIADLGITYIVGSDKAEGIFSGGISGIVGGDSDGTGGGAAGAYLGVRGHLWLTSAFGFYTRFALHYYRSDMVNPSGAGGMALRF